MARVFITSDETREVINGHAKQLAEEYGCDRSYYDQIVSNHETDGFEKFRQSLYLPALRAGRPVAPWITRLRLDEEKYRALAKHGCVKTETAKFVKEANDVAVAHIEEQSLEQQLIEIDQAIAQAEIQRKAIISQIAAGENFNGKRVSYETRNRVREIRKVQ
jgi:hypothetical protein